MKRNKMFLGNMVRVNGAYRASRKNTITIDTEQEIARCLRCTKTECNNCVGRKANDDERRERGTNDLQ